VSGTSFAHFFVNEGPRRGVAGFGFGFDFDFAAAVAVPPRGLHGVDDGSGVPKLVIFAFAFAFAVGWGVPGA